MNKFRITVEVPISSESFSDQAKTVAKLNSAIDVFRKALTAIEPDHEYHDEIVKMRAPGTGNGRRGRRPRAAVNNTQQEAA